MAKSRQQYIDEHIDNEAVSFDLVDQHTVARLRRDGIIQVPAKKIDIPKDMRWNEKYIASKMLQGIENGDSVDKIASGIFFEIFSREDVFNLTEKGKTDLIKRCQQSAIRNARTMTTSAENNGRLDSYKSLAEKGVVQKKVWMSTPDDRTRPTHIDIDGEEQDIDKAFSNGCMFPGDGKGPAEEVWMCRCTMTDHIIGFRRADGSISRVDYTPDRTLHEEQMEEEKEQRAAVNRRQEFSGGNNVDGEKYDQYDIGIDADFSNIDLPDDIMQASIEYSNRMQAEDIEKFNEIFNSAEYITNTDESYYDPNNNNISISKNASGSTVFHESTHWYDANQNYTITEDYGKYKWITDKNGDLTGEREWVPNIVTIKENTSFSEYIAHQWTRYERGESTNFSSLDMRNFIDRIGLSDTYGYNRNPDDVEHDLRAFRDYFNFKGISRTDPDFAHLSDFISAMYYDGNLGSLTDGGHSYDYWIRGDDRRINEITAGYNLLRATGREDLIAIERELAPNLMNLIETEWEKIWK